MEPADVIAAGVKLLATFKPSVDTVDSHARSALGAYDEVSVLGPHLGRSCTIFQRLAGRASRDLLLPQPIFAAHGLAL
jgi:hypothetical protein